MGTLNNWFVRAAPEGALNAPQCINAVVLAANTARTFTASAAFPADVDAFPAEADYVVFSTQNNEDVFYVRYDGSAATVPSADILDGGGSEINPNVRWISGLARISLISPYGGTIVMMAFYKDNSERPVV